MAARLFFVSSLASLQPKSAPVNKLLFRSFSNIGTSDTTENNWLDEYIRIFDKQEPQSQYEKEEEYVPSRERIVDELGRAYGTGRRKESSARVWVFPGTGNIKVNKKHMNEYFHRCSEWYCVVQPFEVTNTVGKFDVYSTVRGGGTSGQAKAVSHGISRALENYQPTLRPLLKRAGLLTRDPRMVERKKPGRKKARRSFQWVKR